MAENARSMTARAFSMTITEARFEWTIEPYRETDGDTFFHAVKVPPGTGRFHTKGQASREASRASGNVVDEFDTRLANEIAAITRERNKRDKKHNGTRHKATQAKVARGIRRKARSTNVNGGKSAG